MYFPETLAFKYPNHSADNSAFGDILLQSNQLKLPVFVMLLCPVDILGNIVINPPGTG
jgi:hypothetical protein